VKHIARISKHPKQGAAWQEVICMVSVTVNLIMTAFGGTSPFTSFIEEKCDIPVSGQGAS
jgi:hypothetical protein